MLKQVGAEAGLTLVELMVTLTILGALLLLALPNFSAWLQNSRIRVTSEAVLTGLQLAKAEAVARNARVRFQFTDTLDSSCSPSTVGRNWVVNLDPGVDETAVSNSCDSAPSETAAPRIIQTRPAGDGSGSTLLVADRASVVFNGLGRPVRDPAPAIAPATVINISNPGGGDCAAVGGPMTCLRITISPAGQVRMCNPNFPAGDPQAC